MAARFNAAMVVAVAAVAAVEEEAMQAVVVRVAAAESMLAAAVRVVVVVVVVGLMLVAVDFVAVAEFMLQPQMARESRAVEIQVTTTVYESAARESAVEPTAVYTFHR